MIGLSAAVCNCCPPRLGALDLRPKRSALAPFPWLAVDFENRSKSHSIREFQWAQIAQARSGPTDAKQAPGKSQRPTPGGCDLVESSHLAVCLQPIENAK
jgi:hypothetical protein